MAFLFQGQKQIPSFTGLQIQTSVQVLPIPILYGMPRATVNLLYYNGFNQHEVTAGKGFLTGGKGTLEYFATVILAIGEGVVQDVKCLFVDQAVYLPSNFPNADTANLFQGTDTQAPWSYVNDRWPGDDRPYKDTAYYGFGNYQLDSSATVPQVNVIPVSNLSGTCPLNKTSLTVTTGQYDQNNNPISFFGNIDLNYCDADPAQVIMDFLTNPRYGAKFPQQFIDTASLLGSATAYDPNTGDGSLSTYCQAYGMGWSIVLNNAESAASIVERWCNNLVVAPVWDGQLLRFYPYSTIYCGTNPGWGPDNGVPMKYYNPATQVTIVIGMDDILDTDNKELHPITFSRLDPQKIYNSVRLDYKDRHNFYNSNIVEAKDEVHIEKFGLHIDNVGQADEFTLTAYANAAAQLRLRRNVSVTRHYQWRMGPLWGFLDPMDIVQIPDPTNWNNQIVVRITSVEDDDKEVVTVEAEDFPAPTGSFTFLPTEATTPPTQSPTNTPSQSADTPVIIEPTSAMLTATGKSVPQIIVGVAASFDGVLDPNFGGVNVYVSLDGSSYQKIGALQGASVMGILGQAIPDGGTSAPINVDVSESSGVMGSFAPSAAGLYQSLCVMQDASGFELFSYTTATLTASHAYALTGLVRGQLGTTARGFGQGSQFLFVGANANFFEAALPPQFVGHNLYVKLQVYNIFRNWLQDLSTCVPYQYLVNGGSPPNNPPPMTAPVSRVRANPSQTVIGTATRSGAQTGGDRRRR